MAAIGSILAVLVIATRVLRIAPPERVRRTGPWRILLAVAFAIWELVTAKFPLLPRPFFASPRRCWKSSPTTIRGSATACGIRCAC
jgi:NitT/TauT family transport system permease protein